MEATSSSAISPTMNTPSTRSRASSVVSTGTKTSIGTMGTFLSTNFGMTPLSPVEGTTATTTTTAGNSIDVLLGRRNFRISTRPGSVLSISSFDYPAPPYHEAIKTPAIPVDLGSVPSLISEQTHSSATTRSSDATAVESPGTDRQSTSTTNTTSQPDGTGETGLSRGVESAKDDDSNDNDDDNDDDDENQDARSTRSTATSMMHPLAPFARVDSESARNAITDYCNEIVRQIDSNHQTEMARERASYEAHLAALRTELEVAHESELDDLRSSLERQHTSITAQLRNDIDTAYRAEFTKMRDETAKLEDERKKLSDSLKALGMIAEHFEKASKKLETELKEVQTELAAAEAAGDERETHARNQVEDMWEGRWRQRMNLAAEQVGKAERESAKWAEMVHERWGKEAMLELQQAAKEGLEADERERETKRKVAEKEHVLMTPVSPGERPPKKKMWPTFGSPS